MMSTPTNHRQDSDLKNTGHHKKPTQTSCTIILREIIGKMTIKWCISLIPPQIFWSHLRETPWSSTPSPSPWGSHGQTWAPENVYTAVDPRSAWHCARLPPCNRRGPELWTQGLAAKKSGFHHPIKG